MPSEKNSDLPISWSWVEHHTVAEINPRLPFDVTDDTVVSFLPMAAVEPISGRVDYSQVRKYGEVKKNFTSFKNGDLIFAKITPCMENGKLAVVSNLTGGIGTGSTEFHVSRPSSAVISKYLFYYLSQARFRHEARRNMTGSAGQLRVPKTFFAEFQLPLAPLAEQERIVAKIEEALSELEAGIEELSKVQKQLRLYRQAVLKWAFTGNLTQKWRKEEVNSGRLEPVSNIVLRLKEAVNEGASEGRGRRARKEIRVLHTSECRELAEIPEAWCYIRAEFLSEFITKGTTPPATKMFEDNGEVPFIKVYNLAFDGSLDFSTDPTFVARATHEGLLKRSIVRPGDILMNIVGPPLGKISIVPNLFPEWNINQAIARFRSNGMVLPKYFAYYLMFQSTVDRMSRRAKATAGQFNLTLEICRDIEVPVTSLREQELVIEEIENRLSACDKIESFLEENFVRCEAMHQSVLTKAFAGKLVPQNPNDEPAIELLERLKTEKIHRTVSMPKQGREKKAIKSTRAFSEV